MTENKRYINDVNEIYDTWLGDMGDAPPTEWEIKEKEYFLVGYTHHQEDAEDICKVLNKLHEENEQLRKDATTLIYSNQEYRKENEELKKDLIDHSALISMLEDYQALKIEETLWNLTGAKSEEEFNELYKPYLDKAKRCWR